VKKKLELLEVKVLVVDVVVPWEERLGGKRVTNVNNNGNDDES
jgi:hypothetical protein